MLATESAGLSAAVCGPRGAAVNTDLPGKRLGSCHWSPASFVSLTGAPSVPQGLQASRTFPPGGALTVLLIGQRSWRLSWVHFLTGVPAPHQLLQPSRATQGCVSVPFT